MIGKCVAKIPYSWKVLHLKGPTHNQEIEDDSNPPIQPI